MSVPTGSERIVAAQVTVPVDSNTSGFAERLKQKLKEELAGFSEDVKVEAEVTLKNEEGLRRKIEAAGEGAEVTVDTKVDQARLKGQVETAIQWVKQQATSKIDVALELAENNLRSQVTTAVEAAGVGQAVTVGMRLDSSLFRAAVAKEVAGAGAAAGPV